MTMTQDSRIAEDLVLAAGQPIARELTPTVA
jgi:hypothetical protein